MQRTIDTPSVRVIDKEERRGAVISLEMVGYLAVFALALVFRLVSLDSVPLTSFEAPQALAALRAASPMASGSALVPQSALLFLLQTASFSIIGGTEIAARLATALAGAALVVMPMLFRGWLGRGRALILSVLLLCSPVLLNASRFSSPVIWSLLFAALVMWCVVRWSERHQPWVAMLGFVALGGLVFLSEPGGVVLALILGLAWLLTRQFAPPDTSFDFDEPPPQVAVSTTPVPWETGLAAAALVVIAVATGFMLNPSGLGAVGEVLAGVVRGFTEPVTTPFLALIVSLYAEPFMWVLGITAVIVLVRRGELTVVDRFLAIWTVLAVIASLLFGGAGADHALWTVIPLTALVSRLVIDLFADSQRPDAWSVPYWARSVVALVTLALLAIFTMALQMVARSFADSPDGTFNSIQFNQTSIILLFIPIVFMIVIVMMVMNLWNARTAMRGIALGVLIFGLVSSLGSGWVTSVTRANDPLNPAHLQAANEDTFLLRQTLFDVADRETNGFSTVPLVVEASDDSVLAWVVRDFVNTRFVSDITEAVGERIVITSASSAPDLGGSYVGQDFVLGRNFELQSLSTLDLLGWWTQQRVGFAARDSVRTETAYLWLRQDVYNGVDQTLGN